MWCGFCSHAFSAAAVTWYKDGRPLTSAAGVNILSRGQVLEIDRAQVSDTGLYKCVAINVAGNTDLTYSLQVYGECVWLTLNNLSVKSLAMWNSFLKYSSFWFWLSNTFCLCPLVPPSISSKGGMITVVVNDPVRLECEASGVPVPSLTWLKEGSPVSSFSDGVQVCICWTLNAAVYI